MSFFFPPPPSMDKVREKKICEKRDRSDEFGIGTPVAMDWRLVRKWPVGRNTAIGISFCFPFLSF